MNFKSGLLTIISVLLIGPSVLSQKNDPVVLTVNDESITKSEFLQVYLKNNDDPQYDKESLDEYVELYKKFKLKVAEAEALGYDTIPALVRELNGYKEQLAKPYLTDKSKSQALIDEAYQRMQSEIKASHILINLKPNAAPEDTLKAYNRAMQLRKRIINGEDFAEVAKGKDGSEDPSVKKNGGDLGYFTAFQMVYPFETAAYETNIGEVSMPVRTNFGYHIVKVFDKREARGTITTAHIMVVTNENPSRSDEENAKKKINEIYEKLKNGESFDKLARLYSDDPGSKSKGGELPAFGSGTNQRMVTEFEDAAFALDENGDFSKPFKTAYGYHIVKRLDYQPLGTKEELLPSIKQKINRGNRAEATQEAFINSLKTENKFVDKKNKRIEWFYENIDSTVFKKNWKAPSLPKNKWMFKYHKQKYDMQSFLDHIENQKRRNPMPIKTFIDKNYKDWQNDIILSDEKSRLEEKYPAYKALLQEYHDGVLLYEIMKDKVWDKAINDTTGLEKFFNKNIDQYQWEERLKVNIYSSDKREMVLEAALLTDIDSMNMSSILNKVNADSQLNLEAKQGKFVQEDHPVLAGKDLKLGKNEIFKHNEKFYLVVVEETLPAGPKELSEAKGRVIQDYQEYLEKKWLEELNNKHTIKVNKDVLYQLGE